MVTTKSGLQYKDIKVGGGRSPPVGFQVAANYVAMVPSGQIFDSFTVHWRKKLNSAVAESENSDYGASKYAAEFPFPSRNSAISWLLLLMVIFSVEPTVGENKAINYTFATYNHDASYLLTDGNVDLVVSEDLLTNPFCFRTSPKSPLACASAFESPEGSDDEDNVTDVAKLDTTYLLLTGMWGKWKSVTQKFNSAVAESENSDYGASIYAAEFLCAAEILRFANYGCCILFVLQQPFCKYLMAPVIYCYLQRLAKCGENKARNYTVATYSHNASYLLTGGNVVRCSGTENENALTRHLIRPTSPKSPLACASAFESPEGSDDEDNVTDVAKLDTTYLLTNGNVKFNSAVAESENSDYGASIYAAEFLCAAEILRFANYDSSDYKICEDARLAKCGENKARNYTVATYSHNASYLLTGGNVVRCSGTENENVLTRHLIRPTSPKSPLACASAFESPEGSDDEDNVTDVAKLDTTYLLTNGNVKFNSAVAESENSDYGASIYAAEFLAQLKFCDLLIMRLAKCGENKARNYTVATYSHNASYLLTGGNVVRCSGTENENALTRHLIRPTSPKSPLACASAFESPKGSDDEDNVTDVAKLDTTYLLLTGMCSRAAAESENSDYGASIYAAEFLCVAEILRFANYGCCVLLCCSNHFVNVEYHRQLSRLHFWRLLLHVNVVAREKRKKDETLSTVSCTSSAPVTPLGGCKGKEEESSSVKDSE
ncbi:UNVERIFIED_CONTAM: Peptidyl-prolyl cis-trans isomerase FKBP16-3, chloroplastic [Sesamum calycinum]|uniref:Peptidyl-prolyl cis-trans isomerase FKBP16-3, chloroplastic n=1 Tax=Sesamum calycinum TaxID=2727403 RepID=A0AAW2PT49_9LAMI